MFDVSTRIQNITQVFQDAPPDLVEAGKSWYPQARAWCEQRAHLYGVSTRTVAAVVSALSPRNKWERNLFDADQVLYAWKNGYSYPSIRCSTFTQNVMKAWDILELDKPELAETSPKTRAFLDCIADPESESVVIDVWAYRVAEGDPDLPAKGFGEQEYQVYADAYRSASQVVSEPVEQVQAVTWVTYRNRVGQRVPPGQMRLL